MNEELTERDLSKFPDNEQWEMLKKEIEAQYTPEDGEVDG